MGYDISYVDRIEKIIASWDISTFKIPKDEDNGENGVLLLTDVSKDEWNAFLQKDHAFAGMLWHDNDNKVYIVEVPTMPHESAIVAIHDSFTHMTKPRSLKACLANRWVGADNKGREGDASYLPFLGATELPLPKVLVENFVTVIVEVGYSQTLNGTRGLRPKAADWIARYPSVVYVILVHISKKITSLKAELWECGAVNPIQEVDFSHFIAIKDGCKLTLQTRKILGIAAGQPILHNHDATTNIDLDHVRLCIKESEYVPPEDD